MIIAVMAVAGVQARDSYARDASALPQAAQTVLSNNFKSKVSVVKIEKKLGRVTEYDVVMTDGSEITFDRQGNWESVETGNNSHVPSGFVPAAITNYVKKAQPGTRIVGIEKERSGYEVELSNGVEMKFSKAGEFVRYSD